MNKRTGGVLLTGLAAAALGPNFAAPAAAAEPAAADTVNELTEIIVTARRVEERLQDVPMAVSVTLTPRSAPIS